MSTVAADEATAVAAAKRSGKRVEIASARTELTQVYANPSGGFTAESAVVPQRVRRADGSWAGIDLSLRRSESGWVPTASVADIRFSDGGTAPAVTLTRHGRSLSLSWPGGLPKPTVSGDAATYPKVLPGVDLVLRATRTGFTHVFVVKTAQAAANPRLRELRFDLGGNARVVRGPDGRLAAIAGSDVLASTDPAVMWDSNAASSVAAARGAGAETGARGGAAPAKSSPAAPGDVARTAPVSVEVSGDDLILRPDVKLLTSEHATFPVYIDPSWSTGRSRWAYASNNNTNNSDTTVARVGRDPESGKVYRSFFDFPLTSIRGKHIESAYVQMKVGHTWSCDPTPNYMYHSSGIASTPRTRWSPTLHSLKAMASSHANEGAGCDDSPQPDMTVNFTGSAVTSVIQSHATSNASNITFAFCACSSTGGSGETTTERWKKYLPSNAKLVVDYDSIPGKPHSLQAAGVACPSSTTLVIGTLTPTFSAIFPDADTSQALTTAYEWVQVPANGIIDASTPRKNSPAGASVPAGGRSTTAAVSGVVEGVTYAFRTKATDPAPYSRTSVWSDWCQFKADTTVPSLTINWLVKGSFPGEEASFVASATDHNVRFKYGLTFPPTKDATNYFLLGGIGGKRATNIRVMIPRYGLNTLYVSATDAAGNVGYQSFEFNTLRPNPAVAVWRLESYPGVSEQQAFADQQEALAGDTPLSGANVSWAQDVRMVRGRTAAFNGSSSQLSTSGRVLDTTRSFSIAAWVRLTALPTSDDTVVASQEGVNVAGFHLGTRLIGSPLTPRWSFLMKDSDVQSSATQAAYSSTALTSADVGRWTHIAGVYNEADGTVQLFVNGSLVATVARSGTPWSAGGRFTVGRGWSFGGPSNWFTGNVADVQVYDRVLVGHDFTGQLAAEERSSGFDEPGMLAPINAGDWTFANALPCYEESTDPFLCSAPESGPFGRHFALAKGVSVGDLSDDQFLTFDRETVDLSDEVTTEYGRSQDNIGQPANPVWRDGRVLRTDQSFTVSAWVRPTTLGTQTALSQIGTKQSAFYLGQRSYVENGTTVVRWCFSVFGSDSDTTQGLTMDARSVEYALTTQDTSTWTHLVGVYDLARREIRLYVNGRLAHARSFATGQFTGAFDATGPLVVGAARWTPLGQPTILTDLWQGDIDDVGVYQGAFTDGAVKILNDHQSDAPVTPTD